ncbi:hypothetical protein FAM21834_02683 [Lentilactobacillus parabuchneri]|uniref:Uncharacterized protein n=1 Tax=Lentilactobacillus parabuchneri TaxID=152331 RepID=A0A1X1FBD0_9LACO|nr:hypothetical protein FAM21823_02633 [Lentilactobacillus parabuchneri]ORN00662.1 hypothetical protein FAM21829_02632 [Lentilactobacillus parabuchneri]ORN05587.1 hypothetical protein FAM21834_02683 [Lentilactobacillus parabuchneri]ORN24964.1 hypothetical protein FAM23169_02555 [Lentilactobacillus parabuchneri]
MDFFKLSSLFGSFALLTIFLLQIMNVFSEMLSTSDVLQDGTKITNQVNYFMTPLVTIPVIFLILFFIFFILGICKIKK